MSWRILAVDDDRDILELLRMTLSGAYEVVTISEPMEAFQLLDTIQPDLVILDIMMPRLTGYQMAEMMHKQKKWASTPIVFLSAKDGNRDIKYGYKLGAAVYLTKPFQPDRLLRNIESIFVNSPPPRTKKNLSLLELERTLKLKSEFGLNSNLGSKPPSVSSQTDDESETEGDEDDGAAKASGPNWLD